MKGLMKAQKGTKFKDAVKTYAKKTFDPFDIVGATQNIAKNPTVQKVVKGVGKRMIDPLNMTGISERVIFKKKTPQPKK